MHLGDRGRSLWDRFNLLKDLGVRASVSLLQHLLYLLKGHRSYFRPKSHQLITVFLRKNVGMHGSNLTKLDIGRSQLLQNQSKLLRSHAPGNLVFVKHGCNLF